MAENSKIEWTDHTFNPWIGCTKVSPACDHCYAETQNDFRKWNAAGWGPHAPRKRTSAANWRKPLAWDRQAAAEGVRRRVFCASLADVFDNHKSIEQEWRDDLWKLIANTPNLDWLLLTKRPQNIKRFLPDEWQAGFWPGGRPNVWLGTTVENQEEADRRIPHLLSVPAVVRFLSCEPLLGPVRLDQVVNALSDGEGQLWINALSGYVWDNLGDSCGTGKRISWVICGGESGPHARPMHPGWARSLRDQCAAAGVAFHFKQWGEWLPLGQSGFNAWSAANRSAKAQAKRWLGYAKFNDSAGGPTTETIGPAETRNVYPHKNHMRGGTQAIRIGKKAAGRLLDGVEHNGLPEVE